MDRTFRLCRTVVHSTLPAAVALVLGGAALPPAAWAVSNTLVISQVYGGGGNTGAPYRNDFIEILNRGSSAVSLTGYSVQYAPAASGTWAVTTLSGTIPAGGYYLVQEFSGGAVGALLPTPDATGTTNMNATAGKVALVSSTTALSGLCPVSGTIVDLIGYGGTASCSETSPAGAPSNTTADLRNSAGCEETDNNSADFTVAAPAPRNSASALHSCQYTLTYLAGANGSIVGTTPQSVIHGGSGTKVAATADVGYHFVSWDDGVLTASRTDAGVTGDLTATASFAINSYTLTYLAGANGSIVGTTPQSVDHGGSGTKVAATADVGYHFVSWEDGVLTASRTDAGVTGDLTATASFAINSYTLTYLAGANGSIVGTTPQSVDHGGSGTKVIATADVGYHFVSWDDGVLTASRTDAGVTGDLTATASFAINSYTLTYLAGANGSIVGTTPQSVDHGGSGTKVIATADVGYHFVSWDDGVLTASRTDAGVTGDLTATASFALDGIVVVSQVYGGGGNIGAPFHNDFIELFNRGGSTIDLTGWSVQYAPGTGSTWSVTALAGSIPAGGYYLVQEAAGTGGGASLPTADATGSIPMNANLGKVALVTNSTALTGTCPTGGGIVDFVGYGGANCSETTPTGALGNTTADFRNQGGCEDTDNNLANFTIAGPAPRNSATPLHSCQEHTLMVTVDPSATGSVAKSPDQPTYTHGSTVDLTATPVTGYHFVNWTGDASGNANPLTLTMDSDKTVVAHFAPTTLVGLIAISQIYGGGGNSGAPLHNDYIELFNRGNLAVDVTGWSVQYASSSGTTWFATTLIGTIGPGAYYLVQEAAGTGGGASLPTADAIGGIAMSAVAGKVALVNSTDILVGSCPLGPGVIDFVGYGAADCSETAPTPGLDNVTADFRNVDGCEDTDDNLANFTTGGPAPRNSASPINICEELVAVGDNAVTEFALGQVAPNPVRGAMRVSYALPRESAMRMEVLDVQGRVVATLLDGTYPAGRRDVIWTGVTKGGIAKSGIYFLRLRVAGKDFVRRVAVTR